MAPLQFLMGIAHLSEAFRTDEYTTFLADSSVGNTSGFFVTLRMTLLSDSMAFVV